MAPDMISALEGPERGKAQPASAMTEAKAIILTAMRVRRETGRSARMPQPAARGDAITVRLLSVAGGF